MKTFSTQILKLLESIDRKINLKDGLQFLLDGQENPKRALVIKNSTINKKKKKSSLHILYTLHESNQ